jgi:hypothetical protein
MLSMPERIRALVVREMLGFCRFSEELNRTKFFAQIMQQIGWFVSSDRMNASLGAPLILRILKTHYNNPPYIKICRMIADIESDFRAALLNQSSPPLKRFCFASRLTNEPMSRNQIRDPYRRTLCTKLPAKCHSLVNQWLIFCWIRSRTLRRSRFRWRSLFALCRGIVWIMIVRLCWRFFEWMNR